MSAATPLSALLACPRCDRALESSGEGWACAGCHVTFPEIGTLPWLFAEPNASLDEWRGRLHFALQRLGRERQQRDQALGEEGLRSATRARLEALARATTDHAERLRALLAPLELGQRASTYETYLALRTRLPPDQGLTTYYANVHRDWCWGDAENDASVEILLAALGSHAPRNVAVLGAGAGRLAYDLHARTSTASIRACCR